MDWELNERLFKAAMSDSPSDAIAELARAGADPNCVALETGHTPLYCACMTDSVRAVEALLRSGANPNKRFTYRSFVDGRVEADYVALMYARSADVVALLVKRGADVNACAADGVTPLIRAAAFGKLDVLKACLRRALLPFRNAKANMRLPRANWRNQSSSFGS